MNKVELILKEVENKKSDALSCLKDSINPDERKLLRNRVDTCDDIIAFINSLPEEPSKVWHDISEEPDENRQVLIISDIKFGWICYYHRDNRTFYLDCKPWRLLCEVKKWAYFDDIINL